MSGAANARGLWALIPIKRFDQAKSRLSPLFGPAERAMLAQAMLGDVLEAIGGATVFSGILAVTGDAQAAARAREVGAAVLDDPHDAGINDAVRLGIGWLSRRGADAVAVVPADIPFTTADELDAVAAALGAGDAVLVPATRDAGTNVLAMAPPDLLPPRFGPGSFARHSEAALAAGVKPTVLSLPGAGRDIDVAGDLVDIVASDGGRRTRALLAGLQRTSPPAAAKPFERVSP